MKHDNKVRWPFSVVVEVAKGSRTWIFLINAINTLLIYGGTTYIYIYIYIYIYMFTKKHIYITVNYINLRFQEVVQLIKTTPNKADVTNSNLPSPFCTDMSKNNYINLQQLKILIKKGNRSKASLPTN
jgi:hypothetical protein